MNATAAATAAATQAALWGRRPADWARLAEPQNVPLFSAVLDALDVGRGTRLVDLGCGSGLAARMAAERGATVAGIDATPELLEIARERVPDGAFHVAALEETPLHDGAFDAATGFNAFQFAADPVAAVREAARIVRGDGGLVAASAFAEPERCESTALHLAMKAAVGARDDGYAPYALSGPEGLQQLLADAGLEPVASGEVSLAWAHGSVQDTILSVLCSAGGARAMEAVGEAAVRAALEPAIAPFARPDGSVSMDNVFRYAIGRVTVA
ncbi:MAG TPA: class I SAM-dependent methyltransferase [Baekduia sp.]|uniref:class I SAM-dependent methyltransferase n=1 Tax=Baekduia sp. TaxID=2600305 RepID=UPI002D775326|nr:class I SAM-dependent methyltransferase [Baekduia sp.]HET6506087.1 class I SAM-dependent methyltransferase [Baekduia sp.]